MGDLLNIQNQIEKLQKQAAEIKAKEFDKTLQEIVAKMYAFGITLTDVKKALGGKGGRKAPVGKPRAAAPAKSAASRRSKMSGTTVAPKYRGPNGETWSGRGLMPRWLSALVAQGQAKDKFAVTN